MFKPFDLSKGKILRVKPRDDYDSDASSSDSIDIKFMSIEDNGTSSDDDDELGRYFSSIRIDELMERLEPSELDSDKNIDIPDPELMEIVSNDFTGRAWLDSPRGINSSISNESPRAAKRKSFESLSDSSQAFFARDKNHVVVEERAVKEDLPTNKKMRAPN